MIKSHPTQQQLSAFAAGDLPSAEALMISAHCDMCSACQEHVKVLTERAFTPWLDDQAVVSLNGAVQADLDNMLVSIMQRPEAERRSVTTVNNFIELDGRKFTLPRALQRYSANVGNWSKLVGKLWQAPVELEGIGAAHFIYMEKGGSVPEHTHRGNEMTLVIDGEFSDGMNHYDSGDLILLNNEHTHAPMSEADEGCLVFSIVDQPLHFTSGLARLLNPFSHLFFRY